MSITIRTPIEVDKEAWEKLFIEYLKFYETIFSPEQINFVWDQIINKKEINCFVALENEKVVGFTHFHHQITTWSQNGSIYLEDLFVDENLRNKGIASLLINEVKKFAENSHSSEVFWITRKSNERAQGLYNKVAQLTDFLRYEIKLPQDK